MGCAHSKEVAVRTKLARNLVVQDGIVKCRIKRQGKYVERTAPYQGDHAYSVGKDGALKPRAALIKWLAEIETAISEERFSALRATRMRGGTPTFSELLAVYRRECEIRRDTTGRPVTSSIASQAGCLRRMIEGLGLSLSDRIDKLTPNAVDRWVAGKTSLAPKGELRDKALYSVRSEILQARCVFSAWLMAKYKAAGMEVDDDFQKRIPIPVCAWTPVYRDPPDALKRATVEGAESLKIEKPAVWSLYWLILSFGCRPSDAMRLRWGDFREIEGDGGSRLYLVYTPHKTRTSSRRSVTIPVADSVWRELTAVCPRGDADEMIVKAYDKAKGRRSAHLELNAWMRSIGWSGEAGYRKAAYELRKLFTSAVRNTYGVQAASDFCGSSVTMVQKYYAATYITRMPTPDTAAIIRGI